MPDDRSRPPPRQDTTHRKTSLLPVLPTRFVGREDEIATVCSLLEPVDVRLITLVGPPGIGKTRLALEVAKHAASRFKHRAAFVDLAPVSDPALVPHTIATALGVAEAPRRNTLKRLIDYLEDESVLLVLDNFEHVIVAAREVAELLASCSGVKVLVTSREPLHLTWEREVSVSPLRVPDLNRLPEHESLAGYSAVALFLERVRAFQSNFALTPKNAMPVAEICVRLDGLPLAIEMAAARVRSMTPEALARRLDHRFELLTAGALDVPERQRTLRSAIAWSYDLLKPDEQAIFRRFAVFTGGGTADAALSVCGSSLLDVVEGLGALVNKSLLQHDPEPDGTSRFRMLESVREFGLQKLAASGELETVQRRHADNFIALARQGETHRYGRQQSTWLETLEREHANLQSSIGWCLETGNIASGLEVATALSWFWDLHGHWSVGRRWMERLLDAYGAATDTVRAKGLCALGSLLWLQAEFDDAQAALEESLALFRLLGVTIGIIDVLYVLSSLFQWREDYARADTASQEGLALSRELNDGPAICMGVERVGNVAINRGEYAAGTAWLREALRLTHEHGLERGRGLILYSLGRAALWQGELDQAAELFDQGLTIFNRVGSRWDIGRSVVRLADLASVRGDIESAAQLYAKGFAHLHELGDERWAARATHGLAALALKRGEYGRAHALLVESLRRFVEFGARLEAAESLESAAVLAASIEQNMVAARLCGAADGLRQGISAPRPPVYRSRYDRMVAAVRHRLDPGAFASAHAAGREMTLEHAVAEVVAMSIKPTRPPASGTRTISLTRREQEVADLIARGLSNRQIAAALFISEHTVESHVEHILNKLGVNARTQIAVWASASRSVPTA